MAVLASLTLLLMVMMSCSSQDLVEDVMGNATNPNYQLEYVLLQNSHPCSRKCLKGAPPMLCRYKFILEDYQTLSKACYDCPKNLTDCSRADCIPGDGTRRPIVVINREMPGPAIEVCLGDQIVVDVINQLPGEVTSIHWHGVHQLGTPYMDGVPMVTQCAIQPGNSFRYDFFALQPGTHFWHSHAGFQRADGAYGPLIVRVPDQDNPHLNLYDHDLTSHILTIIDWDEEVALSKFTSHHHNIGDNKPKNLLINGHGRSAKFTFNNETVFTPYARFQVEQGSRYRFRMINAGFLNCPVEFSVDNHTITIISSDGSDLRAVNATSLVTYAGERFDFVLNADQDNGLYWMRFKGLMDCDERFTRAHAAAVLEYVGAENTGEDPEGDLTYENAHRNGLQVNSLNKGTEGNRTEFLALPELESLKESDESLKPIPDYKFYISYDFFKVDHPLFHTPPNYGFFNVTDPRNQVLTPQINHITMKMPNVPFLPQRDQLNTSIFCNQSTVLNCEETFCECPHVLQVPLNTVVEFIFIDEGFAYDANHPLHLHGYAFRVVAMERIARNVTLQQVKDLDKKGMIKRNLNNPPIKDTVTVPDGGFTILRFKATNPGYWLLHCHIDFHVEVGMAMVLKVGDHEQMPPLPKNFPMCGDYLPEPSKPDCEEGFFMKELHNFFPHLFAECKSFGTKFTLTKFILILPLLIMHL